MARSLEDAGIPLEDVVAAIEHGALSLDFVDAAGFERFAGLDRGDVPSRSAIGPASRSSS